MIPMAERVPPLFNLIDTRVVRGERTILSVDHAEILEPGWVAIIGPSGSGKSTLLRLLNRLEVESSGEVLYRGLPIADRDPQTHRRDVAMVFQRPVALAGTALDNLRVADPHLDPEHAHGLLARVGLDAALDQEASSLSGGELQRLSIARCLATNPSVVLLDEATSALDPANTIRIEELIATLSEDGIAPIWVTHSPEQLQRVARRVIVVIDGQVAAAGSVDDVLRNAAGPVAQFLEEWAS